MIKFIKWLSVALIVLFISFLIYFFIVAQVELPQPKNLTVLELSAQEIDSNCFVINNNWLRKSNSGWWEMYVEGEAFDRGVINGKLATNLIYIQEKAFFEQICQLVPSNFYRNFLKYFIAFFNRDLDENLTTEQKLEIYGISLAASQEFDIIGPPYHRLLNYHAAHDIGHALQNLALVGCSSFVTWGDKSEDGDMIVGRNFDFYVGDKFAENKIVQFCAPEKGYKFVTITWGGMTGVVSGMNMEGLTLTLNAAKSEMPTGSAMPVSLLAREILQYAKSIDEAIEIATKRKIFVSESFLISSVHDNKAVNIEKTPTQLDVYTTSGNQLICTNHFQGPVLGIDKINEEQKNESASVYRYKRIIDLLNQNKENNPARTVNILRDQSGLDGKPIGYGNEKAVNQLISHHSIVFNPTKKILWLSTSPWQLGEFVAYDLNKIFAMKGLTENNEISEAALKIPADPFLETQAFADYMAFRAMKQKIKNKQTVEIEKIIALNAEYYHTYVIAGDYLYQRKEFDKAEKYYRSALSKEIATKTEENYILSQIEKCKTRK